MWRICLTNSSHRMPANTRFSGRAQPFWSSRTRVERIIKNVPAYGGFEPFAVSWKEFCEKWVPGLTRDGLKVGVNWSGKQAVGYDLEAERVQLAIQAEIESSQ